MMGIPGAILFIVAGIVAYYEKEKSRNYSQVESNGYTRTHYYGEQPEEAETQSTNNNTRRYWAIPTITFIVIIAMIVLSAVSTIDFSNDPKVTIENMNLSRNTSTNTSYSLKCDLIPHNNYSYLQMNIEFYDSSDSLLDSKMAYNINDATKDQIIKVDQTVYTGSLSGTPTYAKIYIYDKASTDKENSIYNATVYLNGTNNN